MNPNELGQHYDKIASWWDAQRELSTTGLSYLERAIALAGKRGQALDVGCGNGRLTSVLAKAGFHVLGLDLSQEMLEFARRRAPNATFIQADICHWQPPDLYDLIVAWDSTFHVPYEKQRLVAARMCRALSPGGVLLFTAGGIDGEITGEMHGETFYYSSLADSEYLRIISDSRCATVLLERDQYPEHHIVVIATRSA